MKEGKKPEFTEKTSFRKCHILKPENPSPKRDSNPNSSIGGRLGKLDVLAVTPRVAPEFLYVQDSNYPRACLCVSPDAVVPN